MFIHCSLKQKVKETDIEVGTGSPCFQLGVQAAWGRSWSRTSGCVPRLGHKPGWAPLSLVASLGMGGECAACLPASQEPREAHAAGKVLSKHSGPQLSELLGEGR